MRDASYRPGPAVGTLALLAATVVALASAAGGRDGPAGDDSAEIAEVAERVTPATARRVERLRELSFETVPVPEVITAARLGRIERRELRRSDPLRGLAADEATVRIAGLLADDEELENAIGTSEELAAAAYDTRADRLYVVRNAVSASPTLVEFILAHELTHALEDECFGLADPEEIDNDDAALARLALSEGTATAVMVDYAGRHLNPFELGLAAAGLSEGSGDVPAFVVDQLEWTYFGGMRFINSLRELAGGWNLVDYALAQRPPATTEQVLHPLKYVRDERAVAVPIAGEELRRRGWNRADAGVIGELATRKLLELGASRTTAVRAAAGWDGDRYELWRAGVAPSECEGTCRGDLAMVMRWQLAESTDASELNRALGDYARNGLEGLARDGGFQLTDGALAVGTEGTAVTAVFAPTPALARAVAHDQLSE